MIPAVLGAMLRPLPPVQVAPFRVGQRVELPAMLHLGYARVQICQRVKSTGPESGAWEVVVKWAISGELQTVNAYRLRAC